jgi:GTP pyrophosphokinase
VEEYDKKHKKIITNEQILEEISENKDNKYVIKPKSAIVVKGTHDLSVRYSKCCNPVPGDEIVGFITRGRGISIHRTDCVNIMCLPEIERARVIEAEWEEDSLEEKSGQMYMGEIKIFANNRTGLLADISRVFTEGDIDVRGMNSRTNKQELATISVSFLTKGVSQMNRIMDKIRNIESVVDIERTTS